MRILYFTQFFAPENIAAAFRAADHSQLWCESGHDITVFTGWPNYPTGKLFAGYDMVKLGQESMNGVRVFRSAAKNQNNSSFKKRIDTGLSFVINGLKNLGPRSQVGTDYDVVLVTCGTVFAAWLGVHYANKNKLPLVVEFRDLTYKQMIATGAASSSAKVRAMKALELSFCKSAKRVVVLTEGFKDDLVAEGIDSSIISVVPNGADIVPCQHSWGEHLRLGYFGTMGLSQDVPTTLRYVTRLANEGLVSSYSLVGEGAARIDVERSMGAVPDGVLKLEHGMPIEELERYYASVDMTVVSLRKSECFSGTIPSKIFQSFARGVPVLFVGPEGEASRLVRESGAGLALCGDSEEDFVRFKQFAGQADLAQTLARMSACAVDFMESNYTRKRMAARMLSVLAETAEIAK